MTVSHAVGAQLTLAMIIIHSVCVGLNPQQTGADLVNTEIPVPRTEWALSKHF